MGEQVNRLLLVLFKRFLQILQGQTLTCRIGAGRWGDRCDAGVPKPDCESELPGLGDVVCSGYNFQGPLQI